MNADNLRTAPAGARPAKGHQERLRCQAQAKEAVADARWRMDISPEDISRDAHEWQRLESELADLMFAAYVRNHEVSA